MQITHTDVLNGLIQNMKWSQQKFNVHLLNVAHHKNTSYEHKSLGDFQMKRTAEEAAIQKRPLHNEVYDMNKSASRHEWAAGLYNVFMDTLNQVVSNR